MNAVLEPQPTIKETPTNESLTKQLAGIHALLVANGEKLKPLRQSPQRADYDLEVAIPDTSFPKIAVPHMRLSDGTSRTVVEWARPALRGLGTEVQALRHFVPSGQPPITEYVLHTVVGDRAQSTWYKLGDPDSPQLTPPQMELVANILQKTELALTERFTSLRE